MGNGVNIAHKLEKHVKEARCVIGKDEELAAFLPTGTKSLHYQMPTDLRSSHTERWIGIP